MKLNELRTLLSLHPEKPFKMLLPGGGEVPRSFHVTEVGHLQKKFVDCGGTHHRTDTVQLQTWVGEDTHHRLLAGKLTAILDLAQGSVLPPGAEDFDVEIEYENLELTQFQIKGHATAEDSVVLHLQSKHTDCLAKERCVVPAAAAAPADCCGGKCG